MASSKFMQDGTNIIDGKLVAAEIRKETKEEVAAMKATTGKVPGLAVVIVGERKDSQMYVRMKKKMCAEVGIKSFGVDMPESATQDEVIAVVKKFNDDPAVHGILVQLPLPKHINEEAVLSQISLTKDVDGFHPENIGCLAMKGRDPLFMPCTPHGCMVMLERIGVEIKGKNAVVIGRSNIVGLPAALMLIKRDATVTIVHSRTKNPEKICREADIIIAAVGSAEMVKKGWIKKGAAVIDVGMNSLPDATKKSGFRYVGDVAFDECAAMAGAITPVPGGVGPMTIAMLLSNCLAGAKHAMASEGKGGGWSLPGVQGAVLGALGGVLVGLALSRR